MPCLLDLPPELIDEIVELVHATHPKQYLGTVHRAFLPVSRRLFFRNLVVTSFVRLDRLCDLLRQGKAVAQSVARLELDLADIDPGLPSSADVAALLQSLPSLRILKVRNSTRMVDIATSPLSFKPNVDQLFLDFSHTPHFTAFHPNRFRRLSPYTNLHVLSIYSMPDGVPPPPVNPFPAPLLINVVDLALEGRLLDDPAVPLLLAACPHLRALTLFQDDGTEEGVRLPFGPLLDAVANPALGELNIGDTGEYWHSELFSIIERFPQLHGLALGHGCACAELVASLHKFLLLSTIIFHPGTDITTDGILPLLEPTTRPPSLRVLELNNVEPTLAQQSDAYDWSQSFGKSGVAALLAAAHGAGVELSGYCVDVVKKEQAEALKQAEAEGSKQV
ncbi:hypothetical protein JCM10213_002306 [Rhodosporidiobolus nylandii]